jgi:hypothetical protein
MHPVENHEVTVTGPAVAPAGSARVGSWVLLAYRLPREPSNPRVGVWRKLERLGVARLGDGLVALPADARTREQLDWLAEEILEAGGTSTVWLATPGSAAQERIIAEAMRAARAAEYRAVTDQARAAARGGAAERIRGRGGCAASCAASPAGTSSPRPNGRWPGSRWMPWPPMPPPLARP